MKKENRKMAQERRAQEREKQAKQQQIRKWLRIGLPIAAVVIVLAVLFIKPGNESGSNESTAETTETTEEEAVSLNMDTSLTVEDGDTVNIDFVGTIDGVEFSGGNTKGMGTDLVIGSGTFIDDFEEQLIGHAVGESVDVVVTFPKNYGAAELAGKEAVFATKINGIYK